jgi:hypothetical protein
VKQKVALCSIRQLSQNDHEESKIGSNEGAAIAELICSKTNIDRLQPLTSKIQENSSRLHLYRKTQSEKVSFLEFDQTSVTE